MRKLFQDIETRSATDLKQSGMYVYAASPSTQIILWSYAIDDGPIKVFYPIFGQAFPDDLLEAILDETTIFVAHNASFERVLLSLVGRAIMPAEAHAQIRRIERWSCTAARARACGLPGALELTAVALRLPVIKDKAGKTLMLRLCKPNAIDLAGKPMWYGDEADFIRLGEYCCTDTAVEREIDKRLPMLDDIQLNLWQCIERTNDRGIMIDDQLLMRLMSITEDAMADLNQRIFSLTDGFVQKTSNASAITKWLVAQGVDVEQSGIGAQIIADLLSDPDLRPEVREILSIRKDGGKSSVAKLKSMANRANSDRRIRGNLIFAGAAGSGRMSATGAQMQNFPRNKTIKYLQPVIDRILEDNLTPAQMREEYGVPMVVASELLRPVLIAKPNHWIARGDMGQLEARMLLYIAGAEDMLQAYRDFDAGIGPDLYRVTGSKMFGIPVDVLTAEQRMLGKISVLSFGYAGGAKAYLRFSKLYGVNVSEETANGYKNDWREANPAVVELWYTIERAAVECLRSTPGTAHYAKPNLSFKRNNQVMVMRLPSGRGIYLWYPKMEKMETPWGVKDCITYWAENHVTRQWTKETTYGGALTALAVQGASTRDLIAFSLLLAEKQDGFAPVMCVHDEIIVEAAQNVFASKDDAAETLKQIMLVKPDWCSGLPLSVETSCDARYIKS